MHLPSLFTTLAFLISRSTLVSANANANANSFALAQGNPVPAPKLATEHHMEGMGMDMDAPTETENSIGSNIDNDIDFSTVTPMPWPKHMHGVPILNTTLTPEQKKFWENYSTTTYFTIETSYHGLLVWHVVLLVISGFFLYPLVLVFNNLESSWYLPALGVQAIFSICSCICFYFFINNVPDLFPNMAYTKMILGLFVFTILQFAIAVVHSVKRWINVSSILNSQNFFSFKFNEDELDSSVSINDNDDDNIQLEEIGSPASTLYDNGSRDSFDIDSNAHSNILKSGFQIKNKRDGMLDKLSNISILTKMSCSFGTLFTILHNLSNWSMFGYFLVLYPTGMACLNLFGMGSTVFNLLAHFIKGGVFFLLGIVSLCRYCGCFEQMGGAWNYSYFSKNNFKKSGSNKGKESLGIFLRLHKPGNLILSFEMIESMLILFYGSTNIFLEHLASPGGAWSAKDLQHVSIAFMYFGAGLCGVITELKLSSWRKTKFFNQIDNELLMSNTANDKLCVTPGFSPNPFPVFTIFWTGLLMSKHAQASQISTDIHVQWGSLLTYGSFFRIFTFLWMSYFPLKGNNIFKPGKPFTELITSFCLLCGGLVFMESTDAVIFAMAYRGMTSMFTINVSVGVVSLIMAWIMCVIAFKDWLKSKRQI